MALAGVLLAKAQSAQDVRDVDVLRELAKLQLVSVILSVTTLSNDLKTKMEPRTASPAARLRTISKLRHEGIPVGSIMAPVIPFVNDHEMEAIVAAAADAGAMAMIYVLLRLPLEVKELFEAWLAEHYPLKAERVMSVIRDTRGGKAYDSTWGQRMRGKGVFADLLKARFNLAVAKHGLQGAELPELRTDLFEPPARATPQLSLW